MPEEHQGNSDEHRRSFDDIVKINIYLKNLSDIKKLLNQAYTTFFPDSSIARAVAYMPARTVVSVVDLPLHALVQIEAVVSHGDGTPPQAVAEDAMAHS